MSKPKKWIRGAIKHKGALTRAAKASGQSISGYCQSPPSGTASKRCALAHTLATFRK